MLAVLELLTVVMAEVVGVLVALMELASLVQALLAVQVTQVLAEQVAPLETVVLPAAQDPLVRNGMPHMVAEVEVGQARMVEQVARMVEAVVVP